MFFLFVFRLRLDHTTPVDLEEFISTSITTQKTLQCNKHLQLYVNQYDIPNYIYSPQALSLVRIISVQMTSSFCIKQPKRTKKIKNIITPNNKQFNYLLDVLRTNALQKQIKKYDLINSIRELKTLFTTQSGCNCFIRRYFVFNEAILWFICWFLIDESYKSLMVIMNAK